MLSLIMLSPLTEKIILSTVDTLFMRNYIITGYNIMSNRSSKTKKLSSKGWAKMSPGTHERTVMKKECGTKCFLGPTNESCFPICAKGSCKINTKGIYAAYVRAREYGSKKMRSSGTMRKRSGSTKRIRSGKRSHKHTKKTYQNIATKAKKMLKKRGFGPNLL